MDAGSGDGPLGDAAAEFQGYGPGRPTPAN